MLGFFAQTVGKALTQTGSGAAVQAVTFVISLATAATVTLGLPAALKVLGDHISSLPIDSSNIIPGHN